MLHIIILIHLQIYSVSDLNNLAFHWLISNNIYLVILIMGMVHDNIWKLFCKFFKSFADGQIN